MGILTQEQLLLKAQEEFDALKEAIVADSRNQVRIDQAERRTFGRLLALGLTLLQAFVAGAGLGDEGPEVSRGGRTLRRSEKLHQRLYRSIFGTLTIVRWVYAKSAKKKIEHVPTDARLGLPRGEYSYVMEDWLERLCVKEPFGEGVDGLGAILGFEVSVETAEKMNLRMAEYAIRQGTWFHFRTSADGERWEAMPGSPLERDDMRGLPLQVGLYHASYGNESSFIAFDQFRLTVKP
jgi:hypothetical protein